MIRMMNGLRLVLFAFFIFLGNVILAQEFPTGLEFEDDKYEVQPVISLQNGGKSIPSSIDLSIYSPFPRHQGTIFSCVGWSVGYGALTIERAIQNGWTDRIKITNESSSALFLYNQIKIGNCNRGARISDALSFLQEKGDCLAKYYDKNLDDCEQPTTPELLKNAENFKISDYAALFEAEIDAKDKIDRIRKALAQNKPVIVGLRIKNNFYKLEDAGFWHPDLGDTTYAGGHAMVVVGYDDNLSAFKIFNSWGPKWGKNGMIWIKYNEFAKYCKYAYIIYIGRNKPIISPSVTIKASPVVSSSNEKVIETSLNEVPLREISGNFNFLRFTGNFNSYGEPIFEEASVLGDKNVYTLTNRSWKVGDKFQLQVKPEFLNGYIYVLSVDPTSKIEVHWPKNEIYNEKFKGEHQSGLSPFSGGIIKIPDAQSVLKLAHPGTDNLIILFSEKKIQPPFLQYLKDNLSLEANGNLFQSLIEILGQHQIPASEVHFDKESMKFKAITRNSGAIIPLILKISVI
ncbi:MAG: hypothetical protein RLZZ417_2664 [Bacteroidota bacterium]|jgi:hypothetical protein